MSKFWVVAVALVLAAAGLQAQGQIATVTSTGAFQLRGAQVTPANGVSSWPVMSGDLIEALKTPVIITLSDGSTITLQPCSKTTLSLEGGMPVFNLQNGAAQYALKSPNSVKLENKAQTVAPKTAAGAAEPAGSYGSSSCKPLPAAAGLWGVSGATWAIVGGTAAAGAVAYGVDRAVTGGSNATNQ